MAEDVEIKGRIVRQTLMAVSFQEHPRAGLPVWLPREQIAIVEDVDGLVRVTMPVWLARQKGLY